MIYFLHGSNDYALRSALNKLTTHFTATHGEHGLERANGEDLSPNRLGELFQGLSLFTPWRMVLLHGASQNKALWESLADWIDKIPEETDVIITESSPDKRTKTYKALIRIAKVIETPELNEGAAITWLVDEAQSRGSKIDRKIAQLLVERVGPDQSRLSHELNKLIVHPAITTELIISIVEATPQATAFELLDAVLGRQAAKAQAMITELRGVEEPYKLFGLFSSQVYSLAVVVAAGATVSPQQIAKDAGLHPFVVGKVSKIARGTTWSDVKIMTDLLADLDDRLKSSGSDPWLLLETTFMKIATR